MAEIWLFLLVGASIVFVGFLASQLFDRLRIPDYFILMAIGLVLGSRILPFGGFDPKASLDVVAPQLTSIALAFILFEGGLVLRVKGMGRMWGAAALHTGVAMAFAIGGMWWVGVALLGLSSTTSLLLALAFCGPSATIVLSFLPRLKVREPTRFTLTVEGVMGNVVAAVLVLMIVQLPGAADVSTWLPYLLLVGVTIIVAWLVGEAWALLVSGPEPPSFSYMTSVAVAVMLYALGDSPYLGGNGGLAAFVFGLVLGHRKALAPLRPAPVGSRGLQEFHRELVFLLRTFFFIYLGMQVQIAGITFTTIVGAVLFTVVFFASRLPSTAVLARMWNLPRLDARVLRATVARGMTDTVLILYAISVGVIGVNAVTGVNEATFVTDLLFLVILVAAAASAILVFRAEMGAKAEARVAAAVPSVEAPAPAVESEEITKAVAEFLEDPLVKQGEID
jgi:cell volume regulation protein A